MRKIFIFDWASDRSSLPKIQNPGVSRTIVVCLCILMAKTVIVPFTEDQQADCEGCLDVTGCRNPILKHAYCIHQLEDSDGVGSPNPCHLRHHRQTEARSPSGFGTRKLNEKSTVLRGRGMVVLYKTFTGL